MESGCNKKHLSSRFERTMQENAPLTSAIGTCKFQQVLHIFVRCRFVPHFVTRQLVLLILLDSKQKPI